GHDPVATRGRMHYRRHPLLVHPLLPVVTRRCVLSIVVREGQRAVLVGGGPIRPSGVTRCRSEDSSSARSRPPRQHRGHSWTAASGSPAPLPEPRWLSGARTRPWRLISGF